MAIINSAQKNSQVEGNVDDFALLPSAPVFLLLAFTRQVAHIQPKRKN
jgi:hypothetical protein